MRQKSIRLSPFLQDIVWTSATIVITTAATILTTKLLASGLGPDRFGAYSLSRRLVSTVAPFTTFMMGDVIVRFLALSKKDAQRFHYLLGGIVLGIIPSCIFLGVGWPFKVPLSVYLLGGNADSQDPNLLLASLAMLVGYAVFSVLYAFYRGVGKMRMANVWQLALMGLGPVIISSFCKRLSLPVVILLMAALFLTTAVPLAFEVIKLYRASEDRTILHGPSLRDLFLYGLPRTPSGVMLAGFLTIGPVVLAHFGSMKDVGYLVIGQSLFRVVEAGLVAFGLVALPKISQLFANDQHEYLESRVNDIVILIFHMGLYTSLHLLLWSREIILTWLGSEYLSAVPLTRIFIFSLVPYFAYVMMRSIIDAVETRAINARNLYVSFSVTLACSVALTIAGQGAFGLAMSTSIGFALLGILTTLFLARLYHLRWNLFRVKEVLAANLILLGGTFMLKEWGLRLMEGAVGTIVLALILEAATFSLYLIFLNRLKVRWISELFKRMSFAH